MAELIAFMRLLPELRKLVLLIADLIEAGKEEDIPQLVRDSYRRGGDIRWEAMRNAGKRSRGEM